MEKKLEMTENNLASTKMRLKAIWEIVEGHPKVNTKEQDSVNEQAKQKLDSIIDLIDVFKQRGSPATYDKPTNGNKEVKFNLRPDDIDNKENIKGQDDPDASSDSIIKR